MKTAAKKVNEIEKIEDYYLVKFKLSPFEIPTFRRKLRALVRKAVVSGLNLAGACEQGGPTEIQESKKYIREHLGVKL